MLSGDVSWYWFWLVGVLIYSPNANNLNKSIAKLCTFTEGGRRKSRARATRVKAVSGVCSKFGVQNLNLQQEKAVAEFLSGSDVFVNLPTGHGKPWKYIIWPHSSLEIELPKEQRRFPNESIVVCKIYLKKSLKSCSSSQVKNYHFTFDMYG